MFRINMLPPSSVFKQSNNSYSLLLISQRGAKSQECWVFNTTAVRVAKDNVCVDATLKFHSFVSPSSPHISVSCRQFHLIWPVSLLSVPLIPATAFTVPFNESDRKLHKTSFIWRKFSPSQTEDHTTDQVIRVESRSPAQLCLDNDK
jgi:hypothetical protein